MPATFARVTIRPLFSLALLILILAATDAVEAQRDPCTVRVNDTFKKLSQCSTLEGALTHLEAFQEIANNNGGHRVASSAGDTASAEHIANTLSGAGYSVSVQQFQFQTFYEVTPARLDQVAPVSRSLTTRIFSWSGSGDVTASVSVAANLGCNAADFAGFPAGNIALVSRGTCTFAIKATNAYNAGAVGVVIYNNTAGELNGTLGSGFSLNIPAVSVTQALGQELVGSLPVTLRVRTDTFRGVATSQNVLAETSAGDPNNVVLLGAHYDSVNAGPGINDGGSGTAAILEIATNMAKVKPLNKVRFAFFGAAESGNLGARYYVQQLSPEDVGKIRNYLDLHMIASPNFVYFVADSDDSLGVGFPPGPVGSGAIEQAFAEYYDLMGLPYKQSEPENSLPIEFLFAGVPFGGIFGGSFGVKTAEEASIWGGTAGIAYDPCYHLACDTFANVNTAALDVNLDAAAYVTIKFAQGL